MAEIAPEKPLSLAEKVAIHPSILSLYNTPFKILRRLIRLALLLMKHLRMRILLMPVLRKKLWRKLVRVPASESVAETTDQTPIAEEANATEENYSESTQEKETKIQDEEKPEIKLETAPADFRFPTTNQTRHCFTRYIEYHRCIAAKGEDAPECNKFAKYYRSLCPSEWVERWNEQRENGTFPGPL